MDGQGVEVEAVDSSQTLVEEGGPLHENVSVEGLDSVSCTGVGTIVHHRVQFGTGVVPPRGEERRDHSCGERVDGKI